jgi:6-phosphogluconolactonase/glucosamine-6-phosphate isomerase/deaminase
MKFIYASSEIEWASIAIQFLKQSFKNNPCPCVTLPTGNTPKPFYAMLRADPFFKDHIFDFIMLDEYAGLQKDDPRNFSHWLNRDVLDPLEIPSENRLMFDPYAANFSEECNRFRREYSQKSPLNIAFLGVGMNGHLAMNDPPLDQDSTTHIVELSDETYRSNVQYWSIDYPNAPALTRHGYTLGIKEILESDEIILLIRNKPSIVDRLKTETILNDFPASILHVHKNVTALIV